MITGKNCSCYYDEKAWQFYFCLKHKKEIFKTGDEVYCNVKDCYKEAQYQQNKYTELCFKHFFKCVEDMIRDWRENTYNEKNWIKYQKTVWVFNRDKVIKNDDV